MSAPEPARYTADIDVGGTFTDGFFTDGREAHRAKVLTTPHDLTECFMNCLTRGGAAFGLALPDFLGRTRVVRLSTTLGTNALLQRRGPKIGLLVTSGAERSLYGTQEPAAAVGLLVEPEMVLGLDELTSPDARPGREPSSEQVLDAVRLLIDRGARMIAVSLAHSWRDPRHELRVREIVRERYPVHYLRSVPLQLAHEVTSSDDDHARANTVLLNAYLHGDLSRGLYRAEDLARAQGMRRPLLIVHAAGGSARVAKTVAVQTLSSGPAVAVRGAAVTARALGLGHVVTADMGGTSLDIAVLGPGEPPVVSDPVVAGMRIAVPVISTESVGAGGGSIAAIEDGVLRVGPQSAGSAPGPACYAKGGQRPTVTDANLLLGLLDADGFLGGRMRLDLDRARTAVQRRLAGDLQVDPVTAAAMVREQVNATMARELTRRLEASGTPADRFTLFAFGGGGPLHACDVAELARIDRVIGFPYGSVFSAFGSSTVDVWHRYSRSTPLAADLSEGPKLVEEAVTAVRTQARLDMRGEGFAAGEFTEQLRLVCERDGAALEIGVDPQLAAAGVWEAARAQIGGARLREVVLDARAELPRWSPPQASLSEVPAEPSGWREVRWSVQDPGRRTAVVRLESMLAGHYLSGPALIETEDTVYAVNPGWDARIDAAGNVVLTRSGGAG